MRTFGSIEDRFSVSGLYSAILLVILCYTSWARGGVYPPWQWPVVSLSVLLCGGLFFLPEEKKSPLKGALLSDPVFYLGLAFILLLVAQTLNTGYYVMWDLVETVGMNDPPSKWLPWSVEQSSALAMVRWFFPAWVVLLLVRHVLDRKHLQLILHVMVWNAAVLAIVGIVQQLDGAQKMLGLWTIPYNSFFATFGYVNHGGAFFYLHAALAAGLSHHALRHHQPPAQIIVWTACFVLCLAAAFFSLSRAAGLAALVIVAASFGVMIRRAFRKARGNQMVNIIGVASIIALTGVVLYLGAGEGALAQEIDDTLWGERMEEAVEGRTMQLPSAWQISKDYPVFGCGGWGYRWVALLYIPVNEWDLWRGAGKANVHCDPLQFLCEFGWVGSLLMAGVIGVLVYGSSILWKTRTTGRAGTPVLGRWIALGLFLIVLHSWVDLPFRCPAILFAWCFLLAALPKLSQMPKDWMDYDYE